MKVRHKSLPHRFFTNTQQDFFSVATRSAQLKLISAVSISGFVSERTFEILVELKRLKFMCEICDYSF